MKQTQTSIVNRLQRFTLGLRSAHRPDGVVREYQALVSPTSECSVVPKVDEFRLGLPPEAVIASNGVLSKGMVSLSVTLVRTRG